MYEELIKRLRSAIGNRDEKCEGCPYEEDYPCCVDCLDELLKQAADAIEELQIECQDWYKAYMDLLPTRWYSVKECLPNNEDDVLIYGEWTGASGTKYREVWLTDFKEFLHQGYKPIAWMPLPEPPKEEK